MECFKAAGFAANESIRYSFLGFFAGILLTHLLHVVLEIVSTRYGLKTETTNVDESAPSDIERSLDLDCAALAKHGFSVTSPESQRPQPRGIEDFPDDQHTLNNTFETEPQLAFVADATHSSEQSLPNEPKTQSSQASTERNPSELLRMAFFSAVVIFLHNIPEGLATYVSVIADPYSGAAVAFAIALHNIPEASRTGEAQQHRWCSDAGVACSSFLVEFPHPLPRSHGNTLHAAVPLDLHAQCCHPTHPPPAHVL
jgi:zinc transporter ZupT